MSTVLPFGSNNIATFIYEPFSFTISNPDSVTYPIVTVSNSPGIPVSYFDVSTSRVIFSTSSNAMASGLNQQFVITARDASFNAITSSNIVTVGTGRFRDSNGNSLTGSNFTYYKNEPATAVQFRAPFVISTPTTVPTLPPGLGFTDVSGGGWYDLSGTPMVTVPQSNYLVIGRGTGANLGKIVTSTVGIVISNERLRLDVSGATIVSPMTVGTAIYRRDVMAYFPPYPTNGALTYTWSGLPDGIVVKDIASNTQYSPWTIPNSNLDMSYTLFISGAPTSNAAEGFRLAGIASRTVTFLATRTSPLPAISNSVQFTFGFGETVLFTGSNVSVLYKDNPLNPTANYFDARTAFGSTSDVTDISSSNLPAGLTINFVPAQNRGYLTGTPTDVSTNIYPIRASNANSYTADLSQSIVVSNDSVTFTSPLDTCYNFVLSRPLTNALAGYYPSNIDFLASSASGNALTFVTSDLTGTGLSLDTSGITNGVRLVGTPTSILALQTLTVTATASNTAAVGNKNVMIEILDDTITLSNIPASNLAFVQNRAIIPVQLRGTALSGRPVSTFRGTSMPSGLSLGATGLITGVPLGSVGGTFSFTASTEFVSQPFVLSYTITPDSMIFPLSPSVYTYAAGSPVSIDIDGVSYSGKTVSNYTLSAETLTYGLTIGSNSGVIGGTITTGIGPSNTLPALSNFAVTASAGLLDSSLAGTMTTANPPVQRFFAMQYVGSNMGDWGGDFYYGDGSSSLSNFFNVPGLGTFPAFASDLAFKHNDVTGNTIIIPVTGLTSVIGPRPYGDILRSTDGISFGSTLFASGISNARPYKAIYDSNASLWYIGGTVTGSNGRTALSLFKSGDDGVTFENVSPGGIDVAPRRSPLGDPSDRFTNYYTAYGTAFGYSNGVFLLGGTYDEVFGSGSARMKRSTDGATWSDVAGMFEVEVGNISTDGPVWVATGSSLYETGISNTIVAPAVTLKYSTDQGERWSNATGSPHDAIGFEVVYASNVWLSSGISRAGGAVTSTLVYSSDGVNWGGVGLPTAFDTSGNAPRLSEVASVFFDNYYSQWYVYVKYSGTGAEIYTHPSTGEMATGWSLAQSAVYPFTDYDGLSYPSRIFGQRFLANGPTTVTFSFATATGEGPTIVSPTSNSFTLYQYVTIDPITVTATGGGTIYFFVTADELPTGISFDPTTGIFSGMSVNVGTRVVNLYAKDDDGITLKTITFTTIQAFVVKKQSSAGAWTALVRQFATVGGAQNSVNGRVVPAQQAALGEFTRDEPPDSVNAPGDPNCAKKC